LNSEIYILSATAARIVRFVNIGMKNSSGILQHAERKLSKERERSIGNDKK
jgi:hypothetical protein